MPKLAKALVFPKESKIFLQSLTHKIQNLLDFADVERISKKSVRSVSFFLVYPNVPRQLLEVSKVLDEAQYGLKSNIWRIFLVRAEKVYNRSRRSAILKLSQLKSINISITLIS